MSKTGTSNEGTRKKKDLLNEYPYDIYTRSLFFEPSDTRLISTVFDMVGLPNEDCVIVKLESGSKSKDSFNQIPVERNKPKRTSKKSSSSNLADER